MVPLRPDPGPRMPRGADRNVRLPLPCLLQFAAQIPPQAQYIDTGRSLFLPLFPLRSEMVRPRNRPLPAMIYFTFMPAVQITPKGNVEYASIALGCMRDWSLGLIAGIAGAGTNAATR